MCGVLLPDKKSLSMKRSPNEVSRWRMQRQVQRRRRRWLEAQSRSYRHIHSARYLQQKKQRRALLYAVAYEW
ncbi:hypothetical protein SAMN02982996_00745 [Lonsdalea quercina]|uniref:Uncharacterized protein YciY n=2 Tax=Lonsdalea quercina TaxID=71657 RepID=A0A1H3XTV2_9GAMM|nr:hypothetical protein SAMN02982996_00745 [Lonsdalea quercina]